MYRLLLHNVGFEGVLWKHCGHPWSLFLLFAAKSPVTSLGLFGHGYIFWTVLVVGHFSSLIFLGQQEGIPLIFKFFLLGFLVFFCHCAVSLYSLYFQDPHPCLIPPVSCSLGGVLVEENLSGVRVALPLPSYPNQILLYIYIYAT